LDEHGIQVFVDARGFPTLKIEHFRRDDFQNMEQNMYGIVSRLEDTGEADTKDICKPNFSERG